MSYPCQPCEKQVTNFSKFETRNPKLEANPKFETQISNWISGLHGCSFEFGIDLQKEVQEDMLGHFSAYPERYGLKRPLFKFKVIGHYRIKDVDKKSAT